MLEYFKATFLVLSLFSIGVAQTRNDFQRKYNDSAFEIRPNVWMTAKYNEDGQACELIIKERNNCKAGDVSLKSKVRIKELLNEFAPAPQRGKFINRSEFASDCCIGFKEEYENLTVIFADEAQLLSGNSYSALTIRWKHRKCKVE
jgi:hypothetical protein